MRLRESFYRWNLFRVYRPDVPVVSVGNLTLGGTGKTPLVQYIAGMLLGKGKAPAVISRGYGGKAKGSFNVVSDGKQVFLPADQAGDEPRFLAETLPGVPVLTGIVRKLPVVKAVEDGADVLVLDDGFQHMSVGRDLDLVLFNADHLAGNSRVFPGGDLREPVAALNRCHAFVLTSISSRNAERAGQFSALLEQKFPGKPVFMSRYLASSLVERSKNGEFLEILSESQFKIFAFCGIARPKSFKQTLEDFGLELCGMQSFTDHHAYLQADVDKIIIQAKEHGAQALVTTEKDLVKLKGLEFSLPLYAVRMKVELDDGFDQFVLAKLGYGEKTNLKQAD